MLSLPGLLAELPNNLHGGPACGPRQMFDSETVAFISGECDASSMKVASFLELQNLDTDRETPSCLS